VACKTLMESIFHRGLYTLLQCEEMDLTHPRLNNYLTILIFDGNKKIHS
jgi:hypothetical protein